MIADIEVPTLHVFSSAYMLGTTEALQHHSSDDQQALKHYACANYVATRSLVCRLK